jgi:hypothetical protein
MKKENIEMPPDPEMKYMQESNDGILWCVLIVCLFVAAIGLIIFREIL